MTLPTEAVLPAITYQEIGNVPQTLFLDGSSLDESRFQITIWSSSVGIAQKIAKQVNELHGFAGRLGGGACVSARRLNKFDLPEPESKKNRVVMEFLIRRN